MVWRVKWDPSPVTSPTVSCFPIATCTPLASSLALSGFDGCRVERFVISVASSHELLRGAMVILPVIMTHDHMGAEKERELAYARPP
jgi:hypothetical protein